MIRVLRITQRACWIIAALILVHTVAKVVQTFSGDIVAYVLGVVVTIAAVIDLFADKEAATPPALGDSQPPRDGL